MDADKGATAMFNLLPPPPAPPAGGVEGATPVPPATSQRTGRRRAAVKRCRKKFAKGPVRSSCIKKAKGLPV
jgi:hypothetical protein